MNAVRRIARGVAKNRLKQRGFSGICKKRGESSFFSKAWRKAVGCDVVRVPKAE